MSRGTTRRSAPLLVIAGIVLVLVVAALIAVFARSDPAPLDPASPEGVVQRYAEALMAGDERTAMTYLTEDLREDCDSAEAGPFDGVRMTLTGREGDEQSATVEIIVTITRGGEPFGSSSDHQSRESFELERTDDGWAIASAPWRFTICWPQETEEDDQ